MSWPSVVKQVIQWHRSWLSCLKCSDQSGISRRNVFVRLTSPRCRPHHTQQQASQHRKHIKKTAIWAPPTLNWIQGAMQHDRLNQNPQTVLYCTTYKCQTRPQKTPWLSVQINNKLLSSASISSKDLVKFKVLCLSLLFSQSCFEAPDFFFH